MPPSLLQPESPHLLYVLAGLIVVFTVLFVSVLRSIDDEIIETQEKLDRYKRAQRRLHREHNRRLDRIERLLELDAADKPEPWRGSPEELP